MRKVLLDDLPSIAKAVLARVPQSGGRAAVIALMGDLGAGKTSFVQALARELGVVDTVQSPTYVLMKSYPIAFGRFKKLVHIDAYRLSGAQEFAALKPEQFLSDPHTLVCVEWPERVEGAMGSPDILLKFSSEGAGERERYIEGV